MQIEKEHAELLRGRGLRVTPQRVAVYGEVAKAGDHPSASAVYKRIRRVLPGVSFDTVYRTLLAFVKTGIIKMVEGTGEGARFEPDPEPHHHFSCINCREIIDFKDDSLDRIRIPPHVEKRFDIRGKRIVLEGFCESCRGLPGAAGKGVADKR